MKKVKLSQNCEKDEMRMKTNVNEKNVYIASTVSKQIHCELTLVIDQSINQSYSLEIYIYFTLRLSLL